MSKWPTAKLGEALRLDLDRVTVDAATSYPMIGVLSFGRGLFEREPIENDSPLLRLDNVVLTSHSVGWTEELFRDMGRIDCEGAIAIGRGKPPKNVVNREVLDRPGFRKKLEQCAQRRNHSMANSPTR